ncbi:SURF1 family protein [Zafaria sp. J156]|uniref:SURF1 family protein n=1 Tax=Zafaria sp. J156 TaxID=3116490 RepID=UPI002E76F1F6|nr:SURF1 family protein [Zafaria sp. J156]MEE1620458.1 SURF1 family protein [Zafaria sp. J156]
MLRTALKPQWILALVGALAVASVFVLLSQWQFDRSQSEAPPPVTTTETPVELTAHFEPFRPMLAADADQVVTASGRFLPQEQVLVAHRIDEGREGYWVVAPFSVDDAPGDAAIAVVRGWQPDPTPPGPAPEGELEVTGRLLPTEAPLDQAPVDGAYASLSVAQLINLWDVDAYSGFLAAFDVRTAAGEDAGAVATGLDAIEIGPQPQERQVNWLNVFYGIEWVVFAGFAVFLWWRLVVDDYRREQEELADEDEDDLAATTDLDADARQSTDSRSEDQ